MGQQENFDRIVSALHDAALDDRLWPSTSALIDEAVGMVGTHLLVLRGPTWADLEVLYQSASYYPSKTTRSTSGITSLTTNGFPASCGCPTAA